MRATTIAQWHHFTTEEMSASGNTFTLWSSEIIFINNYAAEASRATLISCDDAGEAWWARDVSHWASAHQLQGINEIKHHIRVRISHYGRERCVATRCRQIIMTSGVFSSYKTLRPLRITARCKRSMKRLRRVAANINAISSCHAML